MSDIIMPRLSDSMEEGTIIKWLKAPGDQVSPGDALAEIETDKATMTYEADDAGYLEIIAGEGDTLAIGATIGRLTETPAAPGGGSEPARAPEPAREAIPAAAAAAAPPSERERSGENGSAGTATPPPVAAPAAANGGAQSPGGRVKASPLARRIATERGVDLATLVGSGPEGRIVKADVLAAAPGTARAANSGRAVEATAGSARGHVEVVELTRTQQVIARRMASSKATIPEFTVVVEVDAEPAFALREQLRGSLEPLPSLNDIVIKTCAAALRACPNVNAAYVDGRFERYSRVNVGMAVASEGSLVVPTIFDADMRPLSEIAEQTRALAARVRDGSIAPPDLAGATFTVSNLGMFGVSRFTAVINPPQAAILAVGAARERVVRAEDGGFVARRVMELTLTADHRIVYGADAAEFLGQVRKRLERPVGLLL